MSQKRKAISKKWKCFLCGNEVIFKVEVNFPPNCKCGSYAVYQFLEDIYE
jgi:hypothetical protein